MGTVGMRSGRLTGHPVPGFRVAAVAALLAVVAAFAAYPTPAGAKIRQGHASPAKTRSLRRNRKTQKTQRGSDPGHTLSGRARRVPDPDQLIVAQGDGSPVLQSAAEFLGRPYHFGSEGEAFDCSGFVRTVFAKIGIDLPRSARDQFTLGERVAHDELEPGDLVFFHTSRRTASHVGIYIGDDKFVHAATRGRQVQVDSLSESYYARHYLGARRLEI